MLDYFNVAQIIVALALIVAILLQVRGGGLGGIFGQPDSVYRSRRGMEKTLFQFTIILVVVFVVISIMSVRLGTRAVERGVGSPCASIRAGGGRERGYGPYYHYDY